jgi:hypothetical protein
MARRLGRVMSANPPSQRRHVAAQARVATALLSVGGFLGIIGALAASRTAATTSTTSTPAPTIPATTTAPDTTPAPVQTTAPSTPNNPSTYGGIPARTFNQQPVTRSHASH